MDFVLECRDISLRKVGGIMPIKVQSGLPAKAVLESEFIFIMDEDRAMTQDIRPLQIAILNLMPNKEETETHLLRALSNTPLQLEVTFLAMESRVSTHTAVEHLNKFYKSYREVREQRFDGLIITGAPVELMEFEDVDYWKELCDIFEWSKTHVTSTLHICWGAQAGLYYHYGIKKYPLKKKISGVYRHHVNDRRIAMLRGFDDVFNAPHSRYTENKKEDIETVPELEILAESDEAGVFLVMGQAGSQFFMTGHPEYDRYTLDNEYKRDLGKGINPEIPSNYYKNDNPEEKPVFSWRSCANTIYSNWLNYYVYQRTPFDWC